MAVFLFVMVASGPISAVDVHAEALVPNRSTVNIAKVPVKPIKPEDTVGPCCNVESTLPRQQT